jgi:hypothetical protein
MIYASILGREASESLVDSDAWPLGEIVLRNPTMGIGKRDTGRTSPKLLASPRESPECVLCPLNNTEVVGIRMKCALCRAELCRNLKDSAEGTLGEE